MNLKKHNNYLIVDLEATCCDDGSFPRDEMETIEIGAVMVEGENLTIIDEFTIFIKPVRHPVLTPFCTGLTSITQEDVDGADDYKNAIVKFENWLSNHSDYLFLSWGYYDKKQLMQDSEYHGLTFPIPVEHQNLKNHFSQSMNTRKKFGLSTALFIKKLTFQGTAHRGIDDARNIARLMPYIINSSQ